MDNHGLFPAGMSFGFVLLCFAAGYIYVSLALQTIAQKTNTENGWLAWIPIANIILMLNIAKKPVWWIILFLIPLVNIVMAIVVWMAVAEARQTELVGRFDHHSGGESYRPGLSGLGRLSSNRDS
jgi:hypothetical protein